MIKKSLLLFFCFILFCSAFVSLQAVNGATARIGCGGGPPCAPAEDLARGFDKSGNIGAIAKAGNGGVNLANVESDARSAVSFWTTLLLCLSGFWAIAALFFNRLFVRLRKTNRRIFAVFNPRIALSGVATVFISAVLGGWMTMPTGVSAQKERQKPNKANFGTSSNPANEPVFGTVNKIGGTGTTQIGKPFFDADGNQYITGAFTGTLTIGFTTLVATQDFDMFVAKYDSLGDVVWARKASGVTSGVPANFALEAGNSLAVDASGNVYVGGGFAKQITLEGGVNPNVVLTDGGGADLSYEPFLAKYNGNGDLLWAIGGNSGSPRDTINFDRGFNVINSIVFDGSGNPFILGSFSGTNFLGSAVTNTGSSDMILARINPANGAVVWQQTVGNTDVESGMMLGIDAASNLYVLGNFTSDSLMFPTLPSATTFSNPENYFDTFIAKYNSSGAVQWAKQLGGAEEVVANNIAVNSDGDIFTVGQFTSSVTFSTAPTPTILSENETGLGDAGFGGFVARMDTNGDWQWAKSFGGLGDALALDGAGKIVITGTFFDGGIFGAGTANEESLASFAGADQFVARFAGNGDFEWGKPIAGSGMESENVFGVDTLGGDYKPLGVARNPNNNQIYISGDFSGVMTFDCTSLQTPAGARQAFIAQISETASRCRIWNGFDPDDNNWNSIDNWNGNVLPSDGDSVYIPYTGNSFDNPTYNPSMPLSNLTNLTVADDRTLTVTQSLTVNEIFWLIGGFVDVNSGQELIVGDFATSNRVADGADEGGFVRGKMRKNFGENGDPQTYFFHVGAADSYLPVQAAIPPVMSATMSVEAVDGIEPNLPNQTNALNKYWSLSGTNVFPANLTFNYTDDEIVGNEENLKLFKINPPNAVLQNAAVYDFANNSVSINGVPSFSNWALGALAPNAANVDVGGRIIRADGVGISKAIVTLTDQSGNIRLVRSNSFGFYNFEEVNVGQTYTLTVTSKKHVFSPRLLNLTEAVSDFDFIEGK